MTLELVPATPEIRAACFASPGNLEAMLGLAVPDEWPMFPEAFDGSFPYDPEWPPFLFVDRDLNALVGNGGYVGPPSPEGEAEIGYEIAPAFRGRGYATRAVELLLQRAFSDAAVGAVVAHTLPEKNASNAVLAKGGFAFDGEVDPGNGEVVWRWVRRRP